ncbi:cytochrome p450 monooxygenase [Grosmannia clavigera kw1407]|uniref:Cytochrome p450 monooxygenase n=1 Tax=Grosmannia clavigera (strain kw1407 / UAMH 11150) TaxID=655863 RepID=F0XF85_GROCL|nr:cytochrome p450 monooxygenase [Grosmannia clavigera kw1407]EFX03427.1 cytochrome p450 monooxygenase [Grosmannia clavigera kw1407]
MSLIRTTCTCTLFFPSTFGIYRWPSCIPPSVRLVYIFFVYPYYASPLRRLPGPKDHHFLIGHQLNQFRSGSPEEPYKSWMNQWPHEPFIRYFEVGNADAVLINSLEPYREVLHTKCYSFVRTKPFRRLIGDIIGVGLVFAEGTEHIAQRKALGGENPPILCPSSKSNGPRVAYLPIFSDKAQRLANEIGSLCSANGGLVESMYTESEGHSCFYTLKITLDVIGIFCLGIDLANLEGKTEFLTCYQKMFDLSPLGMTLAAVNLVLPIRWLPFPENIAFLSASARLRAILTDMVEERIQKLAEFRQSSNRTDLLTYMIEEKYNSKKDAWSKEDLVEQVLNVMATGHETTASALTWATLALSQNPHVVEKLRAEAEPLYQRDSSLDFADIEHLHYLDYFLREVVRVYCPVSGIPREAIEDVVIAGQLIPKGTIVMPVPAVIQHNPSIWGEDASQFDPDRWGRISGGASENTYAWAAFGHGPRSCIGKAFAMLNFKTVILALVTQYNIEPLRNDKVEVVNPSGQLRPREGLWMRISKAN